MNDSNTIYNNSSALSFWKMKSRYEIMINYGHGLLCQQQPAYFSFFSFDLRQCDGLSFSSGLMPDPIFPYPGFFNP